MRAEQRRKRITLERQTPLSSPANGRACGGGGGAGGDRPKPGRPGSVLEVFQAEAP